MVRKRHFHVKKSKSREEMDKINLVYTEDKRAMWLKLKSVLGIVGNATYPKNWGQIIGGVEGSLRSW